VALGAARIKLRMHPAIYSEKRTQSQLEPSTNRFFLNQQANYYNLANR
jgi:hypothetical protein